MGRVPRYALIAAGIFLCGLVVLLILIAKGEKLTALGLVDLVYYVALLPMALAAAVVVFGVLPSSASYKGTIFGGTLRLSGAIVGFALVMVGGYFFVNKALTFPLTVYVHGSGGPQDIVLRNSGEVVLKLGIEPRNEPIQETGQAYFPAIPASFRGQEVLAWVDAAGYESVDPSAKHRLDGASFELVVQKRVVQYDLGGTIFDPDGNPVAGVRVALPEYHAEGETNEQGRFDLQVTADTQRIVDLVAQKQGYVTAHLSPTLGDRGFNFSLRKSP